MKKIFAILAVMFVAVAATSCVKPYENQLELSLNNFELDLPKTTSNIDGNIHYIEIRANGPWEATLETERAGEIWCWLETSYQKPVRDDMNNIVKDEDGNTVYVTVTAVEGLEFFEGSDRYCKVRGKAGTTFLPMGYMDNIGSDRYAMFTVRRTDADFQRDMIIKQVK